MTAVWLLLAFVAGAASMHWFGRLLFRRLIGRERVARDVTRGLDTSSLIRVRDAADAEIERRRRELAT